MTSQLREYETMGQPRLGRFVRRLGAVLTGSVALGTVLTLGDQAIVSGTNFLTTLLIGRLCGPEELGLYSLGFSLVVLLYSVQRSLVTVPYTVFCGRVEPDRRAEYAGSALLHWGTISVWAMLGLAVWSGAIALGFGPPQAVSVVWMLVGVIPFLLIREFARNYAYAHLRIREAILLDVTVTGFQIGGLLLLYATGTLSAIGAFAVLGGSALIGAAPWLWLRKEEFAPSRSAARAQLRRNWSFSRWIFASRMVTYLNSEILILWLLAVLLGKTATGIFAACLSVALFSNPFVQGMGQYLTPRISHAFADGGARQLRHVVRQADLLIGGVMGLFCMFVGVFGESIMRLAYGEKYLGHQSTIIVVSLAVLADAMTTGTSKGLWVLNRPDLDLVGRSIGLAVTAVAAPLLYLVGGVRGIATGWFLGCATEAIVLRVIFERRVAALLADHPANEAAPSLPVVLPRPVTCEAGVSD